MKSYLYFAIICISSGLLVACSGSESKYAEEVQTLDTANVSSQAESALSPTNTTPEGNAAFDLTSKSNLEKTGRKFIRTADVKFKVVDVRKATTHIEDLAAKHNGFITNSNLQTQVDQVKTTAISADSTLEIKFYTVTNDITVRVPNTQLDSLLREMNQLVHFLDYRIIRAEDAGLNLMSSQLQSKRLENYEKRASQTIDKQGRKLGETINATDKLLDKQTAIDEAHIQHLELEDQIAYSTLKLQIYQRETVFREIVINPQNIDDYRPNLFVRLWESLVEGWHILVELLVFFARLWFLFVLAIVAVFIYRRYGRKSKVAVSLSEK